MYLLSITLLFVSSFLSSSYAQSSSNWPGWSSIRNIFVFGDSYTATRFLVNGTQPDDANPFGNPAFPGRTFSNGRNWIDFLTYQYNDSLVFSYNIAMGGASVSSFGMPNPFRPMDQQVQQFFLPNYAQNLTSKRAEWKSDNTLFTSFFGINDVNASSKMGRANMTAIHTQIFATYAKLVDELYQAGARNFLFMNVPPVFRAPLTVGQGNASVEANRVAIADFNMRLTNMVQRFTQQRTDATAFMLDTFSLFNGVLDDPKSRKETAGLTNTTGFCLAYSARTYNEDTFNNTCGIPQKEYFWLDALHPTPPIHEVMAANISSMLRNNEFVGASNASNPNVASSPDPTSSSSADPNAVDNSAGRTMPSLCFSALVVISAFFMAL